MVAPDLDRFTSRRSTVYATNGVIAAEHPLAASAGLSTLRRGGNAFDAAVATAASLNVVEPMMTGIGGDVFMLYRTAAGEVGAMQSCGHAPADATIERVRADLAERTERDPADVSMPDNGAHTVTIPGTARGWEATIDRFGNLSLADVLGPAIDQATSGFAVTEVVANAWKGGETLFTDDHARAEYLVGGDRAPRVGEVIRLPGIGSTLQAMADGGADVIYEGEIAEQIAGEVQSHGGFLTTDDLAGFAPVFPDPISTTYHDAAIFELPPNNQGMIALEALNIAAEVDAGTYRDGSPDRIHYFAEAMKRAFHDGHHYITDPAFESVPDLHSKAYARDRAAAIDAQASEVTFGVPGNAAEYADTTLLTVADGDGNVVSYINSLFSGFGSGLVAGDTGITLQNRGASFSLDPGAPNSLEPGKRPFHTLIPALLRRDEDDWLAFGVMGGYMQPQGHVQVVSHLLDDEYPLQRSLDEPRWRYQANGQLAVETRFDGGALSKLVRRGHDVTIKPASQFGGGQIVRNQAGVLSAATEPRKDGTAVGY